MKKKTLLIGVLGFGLLFGCSQIDNGRVSADSEGEFSTINSEEINFIDIETIKHIKTGCYYITTKSSHASGITQMFIEKDGVSVPYCENN